MFFASLLSLVVASTALASPLQGRQANNTNVAINQVVDALDESTHINIPNIITLQASHQANDTTVGEQINDLVTVFQVAAEDLSNIPVSAGSTTVMPTNDDISITFATILSQVASGLSGLTNVTVPSRVSMFAELDPQVAAATSTLNTTLPNSVELVHIMMLDARQFFIAEGFTQTIAALGF
ncbi:POXA3b laccase small subunit [Guyanagaster necrorhizus]|uniref:POXA3b laccase small subunit n=1 Tax=Guyanagaster necrorhizus TaxID=856835 RepID=A0A9P7VR11_9AGAR|nr:POXA3b laccase small subunit [Guyanagaster necrorhizus MCA 3950]KAG7444870.1 POXA3b laccase small subunit [Guyanagaster necrorhizus MCA 3950]